MQPYFFRKKKPNKIQDPLTQRSLTDVCSGGTAHDELRVTCQLLWRNEKVWVKTGHHISLQSTSRQDLFQVNANLAYLCRLPVLLTKHCKQMSERGSGQRMPRDANSCGGLRPSCPNLSYSV